MRKAIQGNSLICIWVAIMFVASLSIGLLTGEWAFLAASIGYVLMAIVCGVFNSNEKVDKRSLEYVLGTKENPWVWPADKDQYVVVGIKYSHEHNRLWASTYSFDKIQTGVGNLSSVLLKSAEELQKEWEKHGQAAGRTD